MGTGEGDAPTPTPGDENTRGERAATARWYADAAKYYADIGDEENAKVYRQKMQAWGGAEEEGVNTIIADETALEQPAYEAEYETLGDNSKWQGDVFLPEERMNKTGGFGLGFEGWQDYYMEGEDWQPGAAQYVSPGKILSTEDLDGKAIISSPHYNLCGPLAVMAAMGLDLGNGLAIFSNINLGSATYEVENPNGPKILLLRMELD